MKRMHGSCRSIAVAIARAAAALALLCLANAAHAADGKPLRGVALIVGNGDYEHLAPLTNPPEDARAIEDLFEDLGFETTSVRDADARKLRRAIERFVEDAEGADAAIVYYAGHGIEAGGENWLVPVDADLSSLDDAGEALVPLSRVMRDLGQAVPLIIALLDACRDNPFPPGSTIRPSPDAEAVAVSMTGLGETRSVARFGARTSATAPQDQVGALIGFAAEPGKVALDGEAGANSPYAAAVLRHVSAMTGEEFGTVMRMVAEEVYLKTGGHQRPWFNESLRRLLYFGAAPDPVEGEEGDILTERRQLLLTIAALPDADRRQVERVASAEGIPMDALYGMLRALGQDVPRDPARLEALLRGQTETVREMMQERAALKSADPEILRLSALARSALGDGALDSAIRFHERAKARVAALQGTADAAEADLGQRRIEFAAVYAESAAAHALGFDHARAAADYGEAYRQVARWDPRLAWRYRDSEMRALTAQGQFRGDAAALEEAVAIGEDASRLALAMDDRDAWATTQTAIGTALEVLGGRETGTERLVQSVAAHEAALGARSRDRDPAAWAQVHNNLANALATIGEQTGDAVALRRAIGSYDEALTIWTRAAEPQRFARVQSNRATVLRSLAGIQGGPDLLESAVTALDAALSITTRDASPYEWAAAQDNLGITLTSLGELLGTEAPLVRAADAHRAALEVWDRTRFPLDWAQTQNNLGNAIAARADQTGDLALMTEAAGFYRAALGEWTRGRVPLEWARTQNNLGTMLQAEGAGREDPALLDAATAAFRSALEVNTRERVPLEWAANQFNLGNVSATLARFEDGTARYAEAAAAYRLALEIWTPQFAPDDHALTQFNLATVLRLRGEREVAAGSGEAPATLSASADAYRALLPLWTHASAPDRFATVQDGIGRALLLLGRAKRDAGTLADARTAFTAAADAYAALGDTARHEAVTQRLADLAEAEATLR